MFTLRIRPTANNDFDYKIWKQECNYIVQRLCEINTDSNLSLQQIELNGLKFENEAKKFLMFFFGYKNKLYQKSTNHYLLSFM